MMDFFPLDLPAEEVGCAPLHRPPTTDLAAMFVTSFVVSVALAALPEMLSIGRLSQLPASQRWRVRATLASLQQPIAMLYMMPPTEALRILMVDGNPWTISAPRSIWLALFYLFGAWFFEVLVLLHPSTNTRRSYGRKGWWVQVVHHVGFPTLALWSCYTGCAVPGVAIACTTELTVLFTSSYWLVKMAGGSEHWLHLIKFCMTWSTYILRGVFIFLLDIRAILNDQSQVPRISWAVQCVALISTNCLNFMILRLVQGAVKRKPHEVRDNMAAGNAAGMVESVVYGLVRFVLFPLGTETSDRVLRGLVEELCAATDVRVAFRSGWPEADEGSDAGPESGPSSGEILTTMMKIAEETAGFKVEADKPLMDSGMDSKAAVEFSSRLAAELPHVRLPSTLIFDYPTLAAVAGYAAEQQRPRRTASGLPASISSRSLPGSTPIDSIVEVAGTSSNMPGGSVSPHKFMQLLSTGTDGVVEVPFTRWELEEYYDPNPDALGKMYPKHGGFIDSAEQFAASYFGISAPEARAMDPQQRLMLEVSFDALLCSGSRKQDLMGKDVAVIVGHSNNDWIQVQSGDIKKITPYTATGTSASISAARISFCLGLKGPSYVVDTACSSALVALDNAAANLRRNRCSAAVSSASNVMSSAATYVSFSKPRMLSPQGRSFTFDASADGYCRGEGAGSLVLKHRKDIARGVSWATLSGVAVNQDGMSSTMTAPNGPSQQMVVSIALNEAKLSPSQVGNMECHGTGTPLGDPIELGALAAVHSGRPTPLVLGAVKTNVGHLEGSAACPGLLKLVYVLQRRTAFPSLHFKTVNPHIAELTDLQKVFPTEFVPFLLTEIGGKKRAAGLSSMGFGGTNAHAVMTEAEDPVDPTFAKERPPEYQKKAFLWREMGFRLLRSHPEEGTFDVPIQGDIYHVVKHHVVFGSIVVPGVAFVEMALEATRKLFGHGTKLTDVTMVFPFVVPDRVTDVEPASVMRFVLRGDSRFEIQSVTPAGKVTQHVDAKLDRSGSKPPAEMTEQVDVPALRERINEPIEPSVVYDAIKTVGLALGPMFQVAREVWRKGNEVLGRLRLDPRVPNVGYVVHPALMDGTIHILATASIGRTDADLKIFGGVGRVTIVRPENFSKLEQYWVHLTVTEMLDTSQTFQVKVMDDDGVVLMLLDDVVFRSVKPEQIQMAIAVQAQPEDDTKIFEVEWKEVPEVDFSTKSDEAKLKKVIIMGSDGKVQEGFRSIFGASATYLSTENMSPESLSGNSTLILTSGLSTGAQSIDVLDEALRTMQTMAKLGHANAPELILLTQATQSAADGDFAGDSERVPVHAGLWGLARTFRNEHPDLKCRSVDVGVTLSSEALLQALLPLFSSDSESNIFPEVEVAIRGSQDAKVAYMPRLKDSTNDFPKEEYMLKEDASYLVTGGTGALGLVCAGWMLERGATNIILASRSGVPPPDCRKPLQKMVASKKAQIRQMDVSQEAHVRKLVSELKDGKKPVRGVLHAAGSLDDHMLVELTRKNLEAVAGPKIDGSINLQLLETLSETSFDFLTLFSSVAAVLGTPSQANYCAANAFMDSFAAYRRANGRSALSVQWGPWAEVGMAVRADTAETSILRLPPAKGVALMEALLSAPSSRPAAASIARISWKVLFSQLPGIPPLLSAFKPASTGKSALAGDFTHDSVKGLVVGSLQEILGTDEFDLSTPLMEMGLDSLAGVEFRNRLQGAFEGLALSSTMMFDYPTVPDLVDYIWSMVGPDEEEELGGVAATGDVGEQLVVAGHASRVPGSLTNHPGELWRTLRTGLNTTSELPPERWDMDQFFDSDVDAPGKSYVKLGHFVPGIEHFDGEFFGLGEAEQRGMDPHQWLTTEISYDAFHAAGLTKETLNGLDCGVYVGCATLGGIEPDIPAFGPFTNIGYAYSGLSGRVSHTFSLRGPCFTIDTACSSTVVALDCGSQAVRIGRAKCALASGVNLQLSAAIWVGFAKMRGLAFDGNCKTFDIRADGFARGEGMGAIFIQRQGACQDDVPPIAGLVGVASNHDGRAATITAPNGTAQQRVLRGALGERGTAAETVNCLECHGTGTALGDPIEVGAQKAVYGKNRPKDQPIVLAALKSNLGHLEGAAGTAGLTKVILMLQRKMIPPNLWLEKLNPNIDVSGFEALMPPELLDWRRVQHRSSVSSFGFSGTNAHAVLEASEAILGKIPNYKPYPRPAYKRRLLQPYQNWLEKVLFVEEWVAQPSVPVSTAADCLPGVVFGEKDLAQAIVAAIPGLSASTASTTRDMQKTLEADGAKTAIYVRPVEDPVEKHPEASLDTLLALFQAVQSVPSIETVVVVTEGAHDSSRSNFDASSSLWGMARAARLELLRVTIKLVDLEPKLPTSASAAFLSEVLTESSSETEVRKTAQGRMVPRLQTSNSFAKELQRSDAMLEMSKMPAGPILVTGGLGGLGLVAAQQLAELGAKQIVLSSRSGKTASKELAGLREKLEVYPASAVSIMKSDAASAEAVNKLLGDISTSFGALSGLLHAAGVLDKCNIQDLTSNRLKSTTGPKAAGAWFLHEETAKAQSTPELFVLFSSVSSFLGLVGGSAYAAANAYLDGLAQWRQPRSGAVSVRFGPVSQVGLTAAAGSDDLEGMPLKTISPAQIGTAMRVLLTQQGPSKPLHADVVLARANWASFMKEAGMTIPHLADFTEQASASTASGSNADAWMAISADQRPTEVLKVVKSVASGMGLDIEDEMPLMEAGIDSLSAVEFRSKVSSEFRQVKLPNTLMFDYPTMKDLSTYIADQLVPTNGTLVPAKAAMAASGSSSTGACLVLGTACRLPGSVEGLSPLRAMLSGGCDGLVEVPYERWDLDAYYNAEAPTNLEMYVKHGGFIDNVECFDAAMFGIVKAEAEAMDPQQRHLLEIAYAAFVDAGAEKSELRGCLGGVFVGQDKCDWNRMLSAAHAGPFAATGGSSSISSNRISYVLGLKGPSATMDTACSSSLVAADTAAATLRRGRCDVAAVCGVNMLLLPQTFVACCQARMLSADGRCRTFDQSAAGYARGEGCGAQVLKAISAPFGLRSPTLALAKMAGSALNQDGRSANLTSPNGPSQEQVVRTALAEANVAPDTLDILETHGTGTELGDPIEVGALKAALSVGHSVRTRALCVGAVKSNIGHLEGGAGIAGMVKLTGCLTAGGTVPNLHLRQLNNHIFDDLGDFAARWPSECLPINSPSEPRPMSTSVSSFGFGGTNGHVVLVSADAPSTGKSASVEPVKKAKRTVFLFTGQGSQYVGMGKELYEKEPIFKAAIDRCHELLEGLLPTPLLEVLYPSDGSSPIDNTQYSQPAIFSIEYALSELWKSRGVSPCAVLGHSVGEYCAAVVSGAMPLAVGLRLIAARGRAIAEKCEEGVGSMVATFATEADVKKALKNADPNKVSIAAVNGPKMVVVSGDTATVQEVVERTGATNKPLNVSHAFHSPLMAPAVAPFQAEVEATIASLEKPLIPFFSTVRGKEVTDEITETSYWVDHLKGTVHFSTTLDILDGAIAPEAYLEIGATPTLIAMAKRSLKRSGGAPIWASSLDSKAPDAVTLAKAAKDLGAPGASKESAAKSGESERPKLDFNRQPFPWREASHPLIRKKSTRSDGATVYSCFIEGHVLELLSHHIVHGEVVVPGACYLEMILAGCTEYVGKKDAWCIEGLGFAKPLVLRLVDGKLEEPVELRLVLWTDGRLELESEVGDDPDDNILTTHVEATLVKKKGGWADNRPEGDVHDLNQLRKMCPEEVGIDLMYSFGVRCGLPLQPRFRCVRHVQKHDRFGFARLEMERDGTEKGFWLGPSLIDSSFQALMSLADPEVGIGSLKIPLSIKRLQPCGRAFSIGVWSHFELLDWTEKSSVFRCWLMNDAGEALLYFDSVHLQEVKDEHLQKVLQASGRMGAEQQAMYSAQWQLSEAEAAESESIEDCLVLGSPEAVAKASWEGINFEHKEVDFQDEPALASLLSSKPWKAVLFANGLADGEDVEVLSQALALVRAGTSAAASSTCPPLVLLTPGAQPEVSSDPELQKAAQTVHSGLWGFARSVRMEEPDRLTVLCLDLDPKDAKLSASALQVALQDPLEVEVGLRSNFESDKTRGVRRLVRSAVTAKAAIRLNMPARGSLTGLRPVPQAHRRPVVPGFVQLRIRSVGLNFRDVLNVMGLYPGDPGPPGADCSGTVVEVGEKVEHLKLADDIFGEAPGCLGTYSLGPGPLLTQKPSTWSYEEASTMPVIFVTVEESLNDLAKLKKGEKVLIHAAAGGVGLVAIQYAQYVGAEVYATAGATEKHEYLRSLGVKYITSSRSGKTFEEDMKKFLDGKPEIDVVLNSLSHDDYIPRSLACLKHGGRFIEIGKRGIWTHSQMREARPDVMYEKIAADTMMELEPWRYNAYLKKLLQRVDEGALKPINMHLFQGLEQGVAAMQFLQKASNIGKVVITEGSRMNCDPSCTSVLSGGTGALGIVSAQFLVEEGAKKIALLSRSGKVPSDVSAKFDWLKAATVDVKLVRCDVSSEASAAELIGEGPLGKGSVDCLLHLAGALADGMLPTLTKGMIAQSYGPKVHGLHYLKNILPLRDGANLVLFSSTSSLFGSPGQGNYAAANSVLDSLAPYWTASTGLKVSSVQWGPWGEAGMAVEKNTLQRAKASGLGAITNAQGMVIMASVLLSDQTLVGAAQVKWPKFLRTVFDVPPKFLKEMELEAQKTAPQEDGGDQLALLASMSKEERAAYVLETIHHLARDVVDDDSLSIESPLLESGMDSLSGVEFKNRLQGEFGGIRIPNSAVFDYPTVAALAGFVDSQFGEPAVGSSPGPEAILDTPAVAASSSSAPVAKLMEKLNDRTVGPPFFLVPGAGLQADGFRLLASMMPVPVYGTSWPKDYKPREQWPKKLGELAAVLLKDLRQVQPRGPYFLAGHSFGATLCIELARQLEAAGEEVRIVALLDPRSLLPIREDLKSRLGTAQIADTLALLAHYSGKDGKRYDDILKLLEGVEDGASQLSVLEKSIPKAALATLEHVHATSNWYAELLSTASGATANACLAASVVVYQGKETWLTPLDDSASISDRIVTGYAVEVFQNDAEVEAAAKQSCTKEPTMVGLAGDHFTMLQDPHSVTLALKLCHLLTSVGADVLC